jgi:hypothetical protein
MYPAIPEGAQLYVSYTMKLSDNWQAHRVGSKTCLFWVHLDPWGPPAPDPDHHPYGGHPGLFHAINNIAGQNLDPDATQTVRMKTSVHHQSVENKIPGSGAFAQIATGEVFRGRWHLYEFFFDLGTPGNADGTVKHWLDGQLIINRDGNEMLVGATQSAKWGLLWQWSPVYGGGPSHPVTEDFYQYIDNIYVSYKVA